MHPKDPPEQRRYNPVEEWDRAHGGGDPADPRIVYRLDFAFPTRPCPSDRAHNAVVPVTLSLLELQALPICLCPVCRRTRNDEGHPSLPELERSLGRDFALWVLAWCHDGPSATERERVGALAAAASLAPDRPNANRLVERMIVGTYRR